MRVFTPETFFGRRAGWLFLLFALSIILLTLYSREGDTGPLRTSRVYVQSVASPVASAGRWIFSPLHNFFNWFGEIGSARSQVLILEDQNAELRARLAAIQEESLKKDQAQTLTDVLSEQGYEGVIASVISYPPNSWDQVIILDKGAGDQLEINMPVVGPNGLIGQIIEVGPLYSRVRLITDQRSGVAGIVQSSRATGIAKGNINAGLSFEFISAETSITAGDVVLTSGIGGMFPKGLVVGNVIEVSNETNELYRSARLRPANSIRKIERVMVITNSSPSTDTLQISEE